MQTAERISVPADLWREQARLLFTAWGIEDAQAATMAEVLTAADLMGVESHGLALVALYHKQVREGGANPAARPRVVLDQAAVALIDGDGGFGQAPTMMAVDLAAERAARFGISAVSIRNSNHYGAAGVYARVLAERGLVGFSTSSVWDAAIVPTGGTKAKLGTNPIGFAAPSAAGRPFLLDMATSTAAIGKLKLADRAEEPIPEGWAMTPDGRPQRDPAQALVDRLLVPLGGHKGYGLAAMVEILSSTLSGAAMTPLRTGREGWHDVGHFVLALDPALFRGEAGAFEGDLDAMMDGLRATPPVPGGPAVMVAGDPQYREEDRRRAEGIALPAKLADQLRAIAQESGAPFVLEEAGRA